MKKILTLVFFLGQWLCSGQDSLMVNNLDEVIFSASRIPLVLTSCPTTITILRPTQDPTAQGFSIAEFINKAPGIYATNQYNSAQDLRISVRGFGARSAFGIRGVKLLMDGIPLSTPDGQGQVDNLIVGGVKNVELINGASSSLYGNASGGVISFQTFSDLDQNARKLSLGYGSFANLQFALEDTYRKNGWWIDNQISYNQVDGYRAHSGSINTIYNSRVKRIFKDESELAVILNVLLSPKGEDAGGVNIESIEEDRKAARDRNVLFDSGENLNQFTSGINYKKEISTNAEFKISSFYTRRDFANRLPFENGGQVDLLRNYGGGTVQLTRGFSFDQTEHKVLAGLDVAFQNDLRERFQNMEGERGEETLDQNEIFNNQALFLTLQSTHKKLLVNSGLRYDRNVIQIRDNFESDGLQDGVILLPSLSHSFSASYEIAKQQHLRASFSYGFETPTLSELSSRPDNEGGFNIDLKPQQSYTYELGYRAEISTIFRTSLTLFLINSTDELLPFELEDFPGRTFYRNAGETARQGIEYEANIHPFRNLFLDLSYTYSDFKFAEFDVFDDNLLPGIPKHNLSTSARYNLNNFNFRFNYSYFSSLFADNANQTEVPSYRVASFGVSGNFGAFQPYLGVNNLFNADYYDNIRINAFGSRYFEAAPPRNFYLGIKFEF